jgi:hypothetical protein
MIRLREYIHKVNFTDEVAARFFRCPYKHGEVARERRRIAREQDDHPRTKARDMLASMADFFVKRQS